MPEGSSDRAPPEPSPDWPLPAPAAAGAPLDALPLVEPPEAPEPLPPANGPTGALEYPDKSSSGRHAAHVTMAPMETSRRRGCPVTGATLVRTAECASRAGHGARRADFIRATHGTPACSLATLREQ